MQDRQDDVDRAERRRSGVRRDREAGLAASERRSARGRRQRPGAVAADLDRLRLVALRVERVDHRPRRGEGDLVLARASSGEDGDAEPCRHGVFGGTVVVVVPVVSVGAVVAVATNLPTNSVTIVFGSCWVLPGGSCEITTPSNVSTSVSCRVTATLKPAALSVAFASASVWPVTSGSGDVCGPFETERLTVEPFVAVDEPLGTWLTTIPAGWLLSTSV